jgi:hypothetical protein
MELLTTVGLSENEIKEYRKTVEKHHFSQAILVMDDDCIDAIEDE